MTYARFHELWTTLVTNRPFDTSIPDLGHGVSKHTEDALIAYADGDTSHFDRAKKVIERVRRLAR